MDKGAEAYKQYLAGDDGGMEQLIRLYRNGLMLYLNTLVDNIHTAEELTEDTFVKLATKKPRFREESAFGSWLFAIGRRVALDHLRRRKRQAALSVEEYGDLLPTDHDPAQTVEQQERNTALRQALYTLSPPYRQALWLVYYEGCSHQQVAQVMGKSVHSVDMLLCRARQALKIKLEQEGLTREDL